MDIHRKEKRNPHQVIKTHKIEDMKKARSRDL